MLLKIHPSNPSARAIQKVVDILRNGGLVIYPTDTVYGLGCDIFNAKAVEKVARIKGLRMKDADFSFICHDFSHLSDYTRPIGSSNIQIAEKKSARALYLYTSCKQQCPQTVQKQEKNSRYTYTRTII
jgi:tRNA threonylcarbamoyl adenosine modification protein (Sua5/YciO/YrdC/YwlC family)